MLFVRLRDTILFFIFYASFFFLFDSATAIVVVPRASNVRRTNEKGRSNSNRNAKKRMYETKKKNTHTDNLAVENAKKRNGKTKSNRNKKRTETNQNEKRSGPAVEAMAGRWCDRFSLSFSLILSHLYLSFSSPSDWRLVFAKSREQKKKTKGKTVRTSRPAGTEPKRRKTEKEQKKTKQKQKFLFFFRKQTQDWCTCLTDRGVAFFFLLLLSATRYHTDASGHLPFTPGPHRWILKPKKTTTTTTKNANTFCQKKKQTNKQTKTKSSGSPFFRSDSLRYWKAKKKRKGWRRHGGHFLFFFFFFFFFFGFGSSGIWWETWRPIDSRSSDFLSLIFFSFDLFLEPSFYFYFYFLVSPVEFFPPNPPAPPPSPPPSASRKKGACLDGRTVQRNLWRFCKKMRKKNGTHCFSAPSTPSPNRRPLPPPRHRGNIKGNCFVCFFCQKKPRPPYRNWDKIISTPPLPPTDFVLTVSLRRFLCRIFVSYFHFFFFCSFSFHSGHPVTGRLPCLRIFHPYFFFIVFFSVNFFSFFCRRAPSSVRAKKKISPILFFVFFFIIIPCSNLLGILYFFQKKNKFFLFFALELCSSPKAKLLCLPLFSAVPDGRMALPLQF